MKYNRDTVKQWAGDSQWRALKADYQRFRHQGYSGWGSEGFWALAIYRAQRALRKSQRRRLWAPAALLLAVLRKALQIVTGLDLHPDAEIGAGLLIQHGSQVRVIDRAMIGVDCTLSQINTVGEGAASGRPKIGDHVYIAPHACILGAVTIGDGARIAPCSLVLADVPAGHTAIGVPARIVPRFNVQRFRTDNVPQPSSNGGHAAASGIASSRNEDALY
jgi:serine O-acetyltransferase